MYIYLQLVLLYKIGGACSDGCTDIVIAVTVFTLEGNVEMSKLRILQGEKISLKP